VARRPCIVDPRHLAEPGQSRCAEHRLRSNWITYNPPHRDLYRSCEWRMLSARVRAERPVCEVPGCTRPTAAADHIVPLSRGGPALDPRNVQALCWKHHQAKTLSESNRRRKR
jgi:5-methylcytosine-specific restriction endonuclease McrA